VFILANFHINGEAGFKCLKEGSWAPGSLLLLPALSPHTTLSKSLSSGQYSKHFKETKPSMPSLLSLSSYLQYCDLQITITSESSLFW